MEKIIHLDDTASTNDFLLDNAKQYEQDDLVVAVADYQSAGHGMGTNRWESEAGKNLLFSILVHPLWLGAGMQFLLSMAEALALREVLAEYADDITIKWPNDIYWRDRKISGTRIDGNIKGSKMKDMVIGTGININQEKFVSDAPNPVSLYQITGREHSLEEILGKIISRFKHYYLIAQEEYAKGEQGFIVEEYHKYLFRRDGFHLYEDKDGVFEARLMRVESNGMMLLERHDGTVSRYEFKEVRFQL